MGVPRDLLAAYHREVEQLTARRLPQAVVVFLVCACGFGAFEYAFDPSAVPSFVGLLSLQVAVARPALLWRRSLLRRGRMVSASVAVGLVVSLLVHVHSLLTGLPIELMGIATVCCATGMSLFMPWGPWPQAIVSGASLLGYGVSLHMNGASSTQPLFLFFAVATGVALSILGAQDLDLHRFAIFREATLSEEEASINRTLVSIATRINAVLDQPDALDRICRAARDALGCDWSLILLRDEARDVFRVGGGAGRHSATLREISAMEFAPASFPLIDRILADSYVAIPDPGAADRLTRGFMGRWHTRSLLAARLTRGGQVVGILAAGGSDDLGGVSPRTDKLLRGIAQHAAIALNNVRLVADLRAADRQKSEFLSTMSHELRTPLNVIMGYTELMADGTFGPLLEEQRDTVGRVQNSARSLLELIDATLNVNRIEAGRVPVRVTTVALEELFEDIRGELHQLAHKATVVLRCELTVDDSRVRTDPTKLKVVAKNLVGNALKFTDAGHVAVEMRYDRRAARLLLRVTDTGTGIQPDDLANIFDMFRQSGDSHERGGVGLGLYIVKRFVEQLEGDITVSSEIGSGSTFTVWIPCPALQQPLAVEQDAA